MNLSIVSSACYARDGGRGGGGRSVGGEGGGDAQRRGQQQHPRRRFAQSRSYTRAHLAGDGQRPVHVEEGEGLPRLLAFRVGHLSVRRD